MSLCSASSEVAAQPWRAEAKRVGKSSCSSLASSAANRSNTSSCTSVRPRVGAVDLVDQHDRPQAEPQRLAEHELGLRHRRLRRRRPAAPRRRPSTGCARPRRRNRRGPGVSTMLIARALPDAPRCLGEDGDAALALQVVGIHGALGDLLVLAERAGLLQQAVDQRGLAMVDVRDDRDVADIHKFVRRGCWARLYARSMAAARRVEAASCRCHSPRMRKRSVTIDGHRTCVSLEDAFWAELSAIAEARGLSLNALVAEIDHAPRSAGQSLERAPALRARRAAEAHDQSSLKPLRAHECAEIGALRHRILPGLVLRPAIVRRPRRIFRRSAGS